MVRTLTSPDEPALASGDANSNSFSEVTRRYTELKTMRVISATEEVDDKGRIELKVLFVKRHAI